MAEKYLVVTPGGGFGEFYDESDDAVEEASSRLPVAGVLTVYVPDPELEVAETAKKTKK